MSKRLFAIFVTLLLLQLPGKAQELIDLDLGFEEDTRFAPYLTFGYLNKDWVTEIDGKTLHENFWGEPDKRLHGMQIELGVHQRLTDYGFGVQYGLGFEFCFSNTDAVRDRGWDSFNEFSLYAPLHILYDFRCFRNCSIIPFAGIGFNCAVVGGYEESNNRYWYDADGNYFGPVEYQQYGHGKHPRRWNNQLEAGCKFRRGQFLIGATYAKGFSDHRLYKFHETHQNKLSISMGIIIE